MSSTKAERPPQNLGLFDRGRLRAPSPSLESLTEAKSIREDLREVFAGALGEAEPMCDGRIPAALAPPSNEGRRPGKCGAIQDGTDRDLGRCGGWGQSTYARIERVG
jgi:hypothetical protein